MRTEGNESADRSADRAGSAAARRRNFEGTSARGNVQEAVTKAVEAAVKSLPGADRLVQWELVKLSGQKGGIQGLDEVKATIRTTGA